MDRVFLDANVLFSAAYRPGAGLLKLWELRAVELVTSSYAVAEARVNLDQVRQRQRLDRLIAAISIVSEYANAPPLPHDVKLPTKDQPILQAAIASHASHLLTGDLRHFGPSYGQTIAGVTVLLPADYLGQHG